MTRLLKKCRMPLAILIILIAIVVSFVRALTPLAVQYKQEVELRLSSLLGQPVTIGTMETGWYWFEPVLKLSQVHVAASDKQTLTFDKLLVGVNLFRSLVHWQIVPGVLYVEQAHLIIHQQEKQWQIEGLDHTQSPVKLESVNYLPALYWLLSQEKIIIKRLGATIHLQDGSVMQCEDINLTVVNSFGHYRFKGQAQLNAQQKNPTNITFIADMKILPSDLAHVSGHIYFGVENGHFAQWQRLFKKNIRQENTVHLDYTLKRGHGDVALWIDIEKGEYTNVQTVFGLHDLVWQSKDSTQRPHIESLSANAAWKKTSQGWQLDCDQLRLVAGGRTWPENTFSVEHNRKINVYHVFVTHIPIKPLLEAPLALPTLVKSLRAWHLSGELLNTQIVLKGTQPSYILTRFQDMSWKTRNTFPNVKKLSGVLYWQPTQGRLELDSEHTTIELADRPKVTLSQLNAGFEWKKLSHGLRISMERFVVTRPDLVVSAEGVLDNPSAPDGGMLSLSAKFAADDAQPWMAFVPLEHAKPKLDAWLKQDVKRIAKASGQITIRGPLHDFPYDTKDGIFTIAAHVSGVDLLINSQWPLNRDIDADIHVDKRHFNADIYHAILQDLPVSNMNLQINDIGLGKELLLIHGKLLATGKEILSYINASPLKKRLAKLHPFDVEQSVNLDLNLDIPLYPESNDVLTRGTLVFNHNPALIHLYQQSLPLHDVTGELSFNERGLTGGAIEGNLYGEPLTMSVKPLNNVGVVLHLEGGLPMEQWQQHWHLPTSALVQGRLKFEGDIRMTDDQNDFDHAHFTSSTKGMAIHLPAPIGKVSDTVVPLTVDTDFNMEKAVNVSFQYGTHFNGVYSFSPQSKGMQLRYGMLCFGQKKCLVPQEPGLHIYGKLATFNLEQWRRSLRVLPDNASNQDALQMLQSINLMLGHLMVFDQRYDDVTIRARKITQDAWAIALNQPTIVGDLEYQIKTNTVTGHLEHLDIANTVLEESKRISALSTWQPKDMPNLTLAIDTLNLNTIDVGHVELKGIRQNNAWVLQTGIIESPDYQLNMNGAWTQQGKTSNTRLQATLQINNLEKSLERWHITPAVQARSGNVVLDGYWSGPVYGFSLSQLMGSMHIVLKNGRITDLNADTEQKIGLGKLLSILSLQTIPRRLTLDFSDLSEQGYTFDIFKGDFAIKNGVMTTDNSYIDGPVAYASMKGDLDMVKRLYDVDLRVSPYIAASLPVVATIAGGPVAGLATWVASNIINKSMQKISAYTYKISGPWSEPVVQQVKIYKKASEPVPTSSAPTPQ